MSFANWISRVSLFARQNGTSCSGPQDDIDFSGCRASAAGECHTPDNTFGTADQCICATLSDYHAKLLECISSTDGGAYASCLDPNDVASLSVWSTDHCSASAAASSSASLPPSVETSTPTPTSTSAPTHTPAAILLPSITPTSTPPINSPPTIVSSQTPIPSSSLPPTSSLDSTSGPSPSSVPLSSSISPSVRVEPSQSIPAQSSQTPTTLVSKTSPSAKETSTSSTPVPKPSFVSVSIVTVFASATPPSTHSAVPKWSGSGDLLRGYCATPEYTILDGPTVYWAPIIGCIGDKTDCCPFDILSTTAGPPPTRNAASMVTITSPVATGTLQAIAGTSGGFPVAQYSAQATLDKCPSDYQSIGNVCCPSNYVPWSAAFGGQTPCYSTLPIALTPPPIPDNITGTATDYTVSNIPTSAIVNVVYAMQYPVKPASPGLAPTAKIGIGAGVGGAALLFGILISLLIWKHHTNKRDRAALESPSNFEPDMSLARQGTNLAMSRYSAPSGIGAGIIHDWRQRVPYGEQLGQQVLPQVGPRRYPVDWTPGAASTSPPTNRYVRDSGLRYPSPPTPEMYPSQPELQGRLSPSARTGVTYGYPANATELHADRAL